METLRERCQRRLNGLKGTRQSFEEDWRKIARYTMPSRSRFLAADNKKKRAARVYDDHGIFAFRTLTGGMTSGLSSPSRPWFALNANENLMGDPEVRDWLSDVEKEMYAFLAKSNFYGAAKAGYGELGAFGTEACIINRHEEMGAVFHQLTIGEYWIATSNALTVDTLYCRAPMTVKQAVDKFGSAVSPIVRNLYDSSSYEQIVPAYYGIEPNTGRDPSRLDAKNKLWRAVWWDENDSRVDGILRQSGYDKQPFYAPRWDTVGNEPWGYSPGMDALPSLEELQMQAKRLNEAIDQLVKPEKVADAKVKLTGQPGNVVSVGAVNEQLVMVPYQMPYQAVDAIAQQVQRCQHQVDLASYADLFMAITNMPGVQPRTVEEIATRNEEKLTQLGPAIERVNNEKLEVVIEWTFAEMMERGIGAFREPPKALDGVDLDIDFVSILTQMQRMVGIGQIERTASFVGNLVAVFPQAGDKLDVDEMIDEYADRAGAPANIIRTADKVKAIRDQRAQQQQAQQMAENMPAVQQGADAARLLSETDAGGQTLLDRLMPAV